MNLDPTAVAGAVILVLATLSVLDLHRAEAGSITVYTTPALRDLLEGGIFPKWRAEGGMRIEPVYVAAGQQYNRLRMSGSTPEADLFLHASPLFISKGYDEGYFVPLSANISRDVVPEFRQNESADTVSWIAFAWSPLVEVYSPELDRIPDLVHADLRYGLPHPTLSNNGIYTVLFLDKVSPAAGAHARSHTVVQPVNARANIMGIADGSFDVTLGFEAVATFFETQGARIEWETPLVDGRRVTTPVVFCVGLVNGPHAPQARDFIDFLFENETQTLVEEHHFRSVYEAPRPTRAPDGVEMIHFDWENWRAIEHSLPAYEVVRSGG